MSPRFARRALVVAAAAIGAAVLFSCEKNERLAASAEFAPPARVDLQPSDQASLAQVARPARGGTAHDTASAAASPQVSSSGTPLTAQQPLRGAMLIRVGQASVQVDSLETGLERVREIARRTGSIIANTSMQGGREHVRSASLELRIPSARFDEAVNGLAPIGKLESVNVSVEDVGEEYVDVEARVANARRLEQRLIELLANRTGKLVDVLKVEHELARVREEIERYEGRLRYLRTRVSVSTLTIAVHEPYPIVADRPGARPIRDAFVQAWRNLVGVTAAVIASLGVVVPLGLIVALLILLGKRLVPGRVFRAEPDKAAEGKSA
jgi:hypothetical protein